MAKVKPIVECRQKDAGIGMRLMVTVALCIAINEVLSHFTYPVLC